MNKNRLWIVLTVLAMAALACNALSGSGKTATAIPEDSDTTVIPTEASTSDGGETEPTAEPSSGDTSSNKSEFPLPENVSNFMDVSGVVNFQTTMSLQDVITFYKDAFEKEGYTERTLLTATTDITFSMVFDGHASGKAIVIQGVDLGSGSVNVNISLQDIN